MSKTRWMIVLLGLSYVLGGGASIGVLPSRDSRPLTLAQQQSSVDWCCVAGLSCCTIPPKQ